MTKQSANVSRNEIASSGFALLAMTLSIVFFLFTIGICFAQEPKILNYNKESKIIKVEIEGKEYELPIPEETSQQVQNIQNEIPSDVSLAEEKNSLSGSASKKKKKYAKGPATTTVGSRLFNIPTDNLLPKNGIGYDFTHRFALPIDENTANDVYGLDGFAYTGIGLYYGLFNDLEAHVFRSSLTDATEFGLKYQLFKEAAGTGLIPNLSLKKGAPFGLTISSGFQNDNIQNSIDFYVQPIVSKVLIPKWLKVYLAPTWSDKSATLGRVDSLSASFFPFLDPRKRDYKKSSGTFALPIGGALQVWPNKLSIFGEYTPVISGYREVRDGWSFGLQILSRLETHVWTIGVSNVPYSTFGQFVVGGPSNDWHFGFNITARMK